jgi:hypothetical protein
VTLPRSRRIESSSFGSRWEPEVTDEEASEIRDAISRGRLLFFVATPPEHPDRYTSNHREVNLTYFRDPRSGEFRYAVETWLGPRKWTTDFDNETSARERVDEDRKMVNL